jgi:hypothetical protein
MLVGTVIAPVCEAAASAPLSVLPPLPDDHWLPLWDFFNGLEKAASILYSLQLGTDNLSFRVNCEIF